MTPEANAEFMLGMLRMIENRELERLTELYHPEIEFHWPPGLPYGGSFRGSKVVAMSERFASIWLPLQRDPQTRRMSPRVLATGDEGRVVIHYVWRGMDGGGRQLAAETLADYVVRDGRLARAQMFHFDLPAVIAFLDGAAPKP